MNVLGAATADICSNQGQMEAVMNVKRVWKHLCTAASLLVALVLMLPAVALATMPTSTTLTMHFEHEGVVVPGVTAKAYLVATQGPAGTFQLTDAYAGSGVDLNSLTADSQWADAAAALAQYTGEHGIPAAGSATSDNAGDATIASLDDGVYLVVSSSGRVGSTTYDFSSYLILAPGIGSNGEAVYALTSAPKSSIHEDVPPPDNPPDQPKPPTPQRLVDTGDYTWVVPIFAGAAVLLFAIGWGLRSIAKDGSNHR